MHNYMNILSNASTRILNKLIKIVGNGHEGIGVCGRDAQLFGNGRCIIGGKRINELSLAVCCHFALVFCAFLNHQLKTIKFIVPLFVSSSFCCPIGNSLDWGKTFLVATWRRASLAAIRQLNFFDLPFPTRTTLYYIFARMEYILRWVVVPCTNNSHGSQSPSAHLQYLNRYDWHAPCILAHPQTRHSHIL